MTTPAVLQITESCPKCGSHGILSMRDVRGQEFYVVVCKQCRTYVGPETSSVVLAVEYWNLDRYSEKIGFWPTWLALLPGEDERDTTHPVPQDVAPTAPDLTNYKPYKHAKARPVDTSKFAPEGEGAGKKI